MIGEAVEKTGAEVAGAVAPILEEQAQLRNEAEYHSLMFQHKNNMAAAFEDAKVKYAQNPEAIGPAIMQSIKESRDAVTAQTNNPFVKARAMMGDPFMESWTVKEAYQWESTQRYNLDQKQAVDFMDKGGKDAVSIASNPHNSIQDIMNYSTQYASSLASLTQKLRAGKNPWMGDEVENKGMRSYAVSTLDGTLISQPWKGAALLKNPEFNKFLQPQDMDKYTHDVELAIKQWPEKVAENNVLTHLAQDSDLVNGVMAGKLGSAAVDAAARKDPAGDQLFYKFLAASASGMQESTEGQRRIETQSNLFDNASDLSRKLGADTTKLVEGTELSKNIKSLFGLRNDILGAQAKGLLTKEEAQTYLSHIYQPLVDSVLKNHKPNIFEQGALGGWEDEGAAPWARAHPDTSGKVAEFQIASKIIEDAKPTNIEDKVRFFDSYFKAADKYLKPGVINPKTNAAYTASDIAHSVVGQGIGDYTQTPFGLKKIEGYNSKTGSPMFSLSKEEEEKLSQDKIRANLLKTTQQPKKESE